MSNADPNPITRSKKKVIVSTGTIFTDSQIIQFSRSLFTSRDVTSRHNGNQTIIYTRHGIEHALLLVSTSMRGLEMSMSSKE